MTNVAQQILAPLDKTVEIISDTVGPVAHPVLDSLKMDLGKRIISDSWRQLLSPEIVPVNEGPVSEGDLEEGAFLTLGGKMEKPKNAPAIEYSRDFEQSIEVVRRNGETQTQARVRDIIVELSQVKNSSREVANAVKDINLTLEPTNAGIYELSFFERVRSLVKQAQAKAEDAGGWIAATGNKSFRKEYKRVSQSGQNSKWLLSGERTPATSSVG